MNGENIGDVLNKAGQSWGWFEAASTHEHVRRGLRPRP